MIDLEGQKRLLLILLLVACVTGCASGRKGPTAAPGQHPEAVGSGVGDDQFAEFEEFSETATPEVSDPLQGYNRFMFAVNDKLYVYALRPVCRGYAFVVPESARVCVRSCFKNLLFPVRFVNSLLQFKFKEGGVEVARFGINTTIGIVGLFDPATSYFHLDPSDEDFGQTMATYGVGDGCPFVIPILGPSNLRDALCRIPDSFLNPVNYIQPPGLSLGVRAGEQINYISLYYKDYDELKKSAVDPYTFFRNAYKQNRDKKIEK